eukprot:m.78963 g.78963  ORF g.78963 m.78963 type:complete len:62 (-) comp12697_c0_seq3:1031-1216(-)
MAEQQMTIPSIMPIRYRAQSTLASVNDEAEFMHLICPPFHMYAVVPSIYSWPLFYFHPPIH